MLRDRGFDWIATQEAHTRGFSDFEQLAYAVDQGRAIVTFNVKDFVRLAQRTVQTGFHHNGIIVSDHLAFKDLLRRTLILLQRHAEGSLTDTLLWLQEYKESEVT